MFISNSNDGNPTSGKAERLGQAWIVKYLRGVRFWKPLEDRYFNFGMFVVVWVIREEGNIIPISSSGKETAWEHILMYSSLGELRLCDPHSNNGLQIFWSAITRNVRLAKNASSGKDKMLVPIWITLNSLRDMRLCMLGRALSFSQQWI